MPQPCQYQVDCTFALDEDTRPGQIAHVFVIRDHNRQALLKAQCQPNVFLP